MKVDVEQSRRTVVDEYESAVARAKAIRDERLRTLDWLAENAKNGEASTKEPAATLEAEVSGAAKTGMFKIVRQAVLHADGEFTRTDIEALVRKENPGMSPSRLRILRILKKLVVKNAIRIKRPGRGRRPTWYEVVVPNTGGTQ